LCIFYNTVFTHCPFRETKHKHQRNKRNMQSAWEVGEDKIVSYWSNTLKPIIWKHYKKNKYKRKMFSHWIHKLSSCHPNVLSVVGQFVLKTMPSQFMLFVVICVILGPTEPAVVVSTNVLHIYYIPIRNERIMHFLS
jgi:hypothetical protein